MLRPLMNSSLRLGHHQIDRDHQALFDLIDMLGSAIRADRGEEICAMIIDELICYTKVHFEMEEQLMCKHSYPAAKTHKAEHDGFVGKVVRLHERMSNGSAPLSMETLDVMRDWLNHHILKTDKAFVIALGTSGAIHAA